MHLRFTLRRKALLWGVTLVAVAMTLLAWIQARQLGDDYNALIQDQQGAVAQQMADDLSDRLDTRLAMLERASLAVPPQAMTDPVEQRRFFDRLSGARPFFDGMALIALDGNMVANDPPLHGKHINVADREYFATVIATGRSTISKPLKARTTEQPSVLMAVPVKDADAHLIGILAGGLNLSRTDLFSGARRTAASMDANVEITTGGAERIYIVHPDPTRLLQSAMAMPPQGRGADDDLHSVATVRSSGWQLHLVTPDEATFAPLYAARHRTLAEIAAFALAAAAAVWWGVGLALRPLGRLKEAMRQLREQRNPLWLSVPQADDEIGDLARAFSELMRQSADHQAELAAVADASPLGLFRTNEHGEITYTNAAYQAILGTKDSVDLHGWTDLLPGPERPAGTEVWQRALSRRASWRTMQSLRRPDGTQVLVSIRIAPIVVDGQLRGHAGTLSDITERARNEKAQRTLTAVFDATTDLVIQSDTDAQITYLNPAARRVRGWSSTDPCQGRMLAEYLPPVTVQQFSKEVLPQAARSGLWVGESWFYSRDLREVPASLMVIAHCDDRGKVEYFSGIFRDISEEKASREALRQSEQTLRSLTDALPILVAAVDQDERYLFANPAYIQAMQDQGDTPLVGRTILEVLGPGVYQSIKPFVDRAMAGERVSYERERYIGQTRRIQEAVYIPQFDANGAVRGVIVVVQDVTERKREEMLLREMAHVDPLSGLLNRAGFDDRLQAMVATARKNDSRIGFLYIDLDRFKAVNDTYGHATGDNLLRIFAQRLRNALRPDDLVARLGGDEFAVAIGNARDMTVAEVVAEKIITIAGTQFWIDGNAISVGASVGVSIWSPEEPGVELALQRADTMLYEAKEAGRGQYKAGGAEVTPPRIPA
ncbi:PAS domain-containing protein [Ideonella oryzae]|uniref:PAS domain-containing protein n=1 Tax=Ideonella oryzae TaxID=2937441 RepID=A0ABT1BT67_9BURK|nr:PAS domain-containing protein [Ideonella oryzae]MCO5978757.1 PAS domain-containing protein [Ideonella oryzae]